MRPTLPAGNHDVDPVCGANYRHHLFIIVGIDEPGPKMAAVRVALGRAAVFQITNRLSSMLEEELSYVLFAPTVLMEEPGVFRTDHHECVAHDVHLYIP